MRTSEDPGEGGGIERADQLIHNAPHAVVGIDGRGIVTVWNDSAATTFGWSRQEAVGAPIQTLMIPPRLRAAHARAMRRLTNGGEPRILNRRVEMPARHRDGRTLSVDMMIVDAPGLDGETGYLAFMRDVTAARATDARLSQIARLPDETPTPVLRVSPEGEVLYANAAARRIVPRQRVPVAWRQAILEAFERRRRGEFTAVGGDRVFAVTIVPVEGTGYVDLFGRDVTDQELAQSELRAGVEALRDLYEITSDAGLDLGDKVVRLLDLMARRFGLGTGVLSRVVPRGLEVMEVRAFNSVLVRGSVTPYGEALGAEVVRSGDVVTLPRISASRFRAHYARKVFGLNAYIGVPVYADGRMYGVLSFSSPTARSAAFRAADVEFLRLIARWIGGELERETIASDLAIANQELLHTARRAGELADQAAAASRAKSEFLAAMSHELRTPLHGIIGTIDLLAQRPLDLEARSQVDVLASSADRLLATVNEVLDFSRVEAGAIGIEHEQVDVRALLNDVVALHRANAEEKGLVLQFLVEDDLPAAMDLDPGRIAQVVGNLVGNAVKFTEHGQVLVRAGAAGRRLRVVVEDTGIGMNRTTVANLFRPFYQADASTARRYGGTGLGLAIASGIVGAMHGTLTVESDPGIGTKMTMVVPPLDPDRDAPRPAASPVPTTPEAGGGFAGPHGRAFHLLRTPQLRESPRQRPLVLIVDDDPIGISIATTMLGNLGCEVLPFSDSAGALDHLLAAEPGQAPDLVLADLHLPGLDGWGLAREIRTAAGPGVRDVPIVAVSADAFEQARRRCADAGMDGHLAKPFRASDIAVVIETWLPRAGRLRPPAVVDPAGAEPIGAALPEVLTEALASGGRGRAIEFLDLFLEATDAAAAAILSALANSRETEAAEMAHRMHGSAQAFGCDGLVVVARAVEEVGKTRRSAVYTARLADRLRSELDLVHARFAPIRQALVVAETGTSSVAG